MNTFPTLQTPRLRLRELLPADAPALFAIHSDTANMRWFGVDPMTDLEQAQVLIKTFAQWRTHANPGTRWGIEHDGELVGTCGLFKWNRAWNSCSLSCELAPAARGKGLMTEALRTSLDWGFAHMQLHRIEALVHPQNAASHALLERLGFKIEGTLREAGFWKGEQHDLAILGLLARDWRDKK